jgi:hypothetical protein
LSLLSVCRNDIVVTGIEDVRASSSAQRSQIVSIGETEEMAELFSRNPEALRQIPRAGPQRRKIRSARVLAGGLTSVEAPCGLTSNRFVSRFIRKVIHGPPLSYPVVAWPDLGFGGLSFAVDAI